MEFDMKDQLVRQTIMTTQEDVSELKEDLDRIEEKIDKLNWWKSLHNTSLVCVIVIRVIIMGIQVLYML